MKLPIILQSRERVVTQAGFLIYEVMIAFSLTTLFITSNLVLKYSMDRLYEFSLKRLERLEQNVVEADYFLRERSLMSTTTEILPYGNETLEYRFGSLSVLVSDLKKAKGRNTCEVDPDLNLSRAEVQIGDLDLGNGNGSTDLEVRNGFVYLTADSASGTAPDFYIIDAQGPLIPVIISSLNTGPGLSAIEVAGPYAYVANNGSTNQLQIIDLTNRADPKIISKLKLPPPYASSTVAGASAIFYSQGLVYLGTHKWEGSEFSVVDVRDPGNPRFLGGFETSTLVNDIYVSGPLAFLAASDRGQLRVLDVSDPANIRELEYFSPTGWETQEGKVVDIFESRLNFGRTTGGFNIIANPEILAFATSSSLGESFNHDIPGGVYGLLRRREQFFLATRALGQEFQVWDGTLLEKKTLALGFSPVKMACDGQTFYFATGDERGLGILKEKDE